jgi:uncharacterized membrane protein
MEMFNEELTAQLKKMMIDHENEKKSYYEWWQGQNDFEHMKRVFMTHYLESALYQYKGYNQEQYLDWIVSHIEKQKKKEEDRKKRAIKKKDKIKIKITKEKEVTGPIYDDDEKPTYYKW